MTRSLVLSLSVLLCHVAAVRADDDPSVAVGASISATNMNARTSWSAAGSFEFRLNRVAGLELEATVVPKLKAEFPGAMILALQQAALLASGGFMPVIYPPPSFTNHRGRAVIFTNNVRLHVPTTSDRVDPFFVAGAGVASLRESADYVYTPFYGPVLPRPGGVLVPSIPVGVPTIEPIKSSSTTLALTLGGGIGVRVASALWIDGDLRIFRLLDFDDRNLGRFGVGVRYQF